MGTIEFNYLQQVISYVLSIWELYFRLPLNQPKRVELVDPAYFDGVIKKEISSKRYLYKVSSWCGNKYEVIQLRDKGNFMAGDKSIFIRYTWFPRMKNDEDEIITRRLFSLDSQKLMTCLRAPPFRNFNTLLVNSNLVITCIGRERLILSRK